jgi:acyl carrier protein
VSEVINRIRGILCRELNMTSESLASDRRLREDLGMDSVIALNLIFAAEKELKVTLREEDVVALVTVGDLERLIDRVTRA